MRSSSRFALVVVLSLGIVHCTGETVVTDSGGDDAADARGDSTVNDVPRVDAGDANAMDVSIDTPAADVADVSPGDVIAVDTPSSDVTNPPVCPVSPPSGNCTHDGLTCSYGDDPRPGCRTTATCTGETWQLVSPRCTPLPTDCGTSPPAMGSTCSNSGDICQYGDGTRCTCSECPTVGPVCMPGPTPVWRCVPPPSDTRCPRTLPNLGETCMPDGVSCDYDGCGAGRAVRCDGGIWVEAPVPCPA